MIFISYSCVNATLAGCLDRSLRALGHRTWIDHRELDLQRPLEAQIAEAIQCSTSFLVLLSAWARRSPWVSFERSEALRWKLQRIELEVDELHSTLPYSIEHALSLRRIRSPTQRLQPTD